MSRRLVFQSNRPAARSVIRSKLPIERQSSSSSLNHPTQASSSLATAKPVWLAIQPHPYAARYQIGSILLHKVIGLGNGHEREILTHPVPGVIERIGEQSRIFQAVNHQHRHLRL